MDPTSPITLGAVEGALRGVIDPELGDNVVDLGMYHGAVVSPTGQVSVRLALTTAACPLRGQLKHDIVERVGSLPGVTSVEVETSEMSREDKRHLMDRARRRAQDRALLTEIPGRTRILAISSGKGGVGKSSVTVNLAVSLASRGYTVGLLDADIAGFSVPRMLGMEGGLAASAAIVGDEAGGVAGDVGGVAGGTEEAGGQRSRPRIEPKVKQVGAGLIKVLSMGFLSAEDEAVMWRGLILNRALQHFLEDVAWGDLDYLLLDMPPGTGDIQMGLARMLPRAEVLIVTTPALAAQKVAARAADAARKGYLRVAGVIENMSGFTGDDGHHYELFGAGGGARLASEVGVPLLGQVPIEPTISAGGDAGVPAALGNGPAAVAFAALTDAVVEVAPIVAMQDCTARLLDVVEAALGARP